MAHNNIRPLRKTDDPFGGDAPDVAQPAARTSDPLAELARLIGQSDPFAEFGKAGAQRAGRDGPTQQREPASPGTMPDWRAEAARADAERGLPPQDYPDYGAVHDQHHPGAREAFGHDPYAQSAPGLAPRDAHLSDAAAAYAHGHEVARDAGYPAFLDRRADPRIQPGAGSFQPPRQHADAAERDAHGYEPDPYYRDDLNEDEYYEDAPRSHRRGRMLVVMAVLCLAVVGTAGAFAYRSFSGRAASSSPPPVIKAETAPAKIVPAVQASETQSSKLIYDRVAGDRAQTERMVSREEQPVPVRSAAPVRVILPSDATASTGLPAASALNEPKRVRTVSIRPEGQGDSPAARAAPPPARPMPRAAAPVPAATPAAPTNAPLSLAPSRADTPRTASAAGPVALAPTAVAAPSRGGYLVQVASRRSEADAQASFRVLQQRFPNDLGPRTPIIQRADLGSRGVFYRSMVGPFATAEQANQFCAGFRSAGGSCLVHRN